MNHYQSYSYEDFLERWGEQFSKIPALLEYLGAKKTGHEKFDKVNFLRPDELEIFQKDWIWLLGKLDNEIEYGFFKPEWIPIQSDDYDYHLDISSTPFRILTFNYFQNDPHHWIEVEFAPDLELFMLDLDKGAEVIEGYFENDWNKYMKEFWDAADHLNELGYQGLIDPEPTAPENFFNDEKFEVVEEPEKLIIRGVSSLVVDLLGRNTQIKMSGFLSEFYPPPDAEIKDVKSLVYLLRSVGYGSDIRYEFNFQQDGTECNCYYECGVLELNSLSTNARKGLLDILKQIER